MTCWASQAADNHAADEGRAEARAEHVGTFTQDATDEVLSEDGNCHWLLGAVDSIEPLFLAALWASPEDAFAKIVALRDALRTAAQQNKVIAADIADRAEKLARGFEREPDFDRLNTLPLAAVCPVPMFPQVRRIPGERAVWPAGLTHLEVK